MMNEQKEHKVIKKLKRKYIEIKIIKSFSGKIKYDKWNTVH
jgi:hypothetical protein